MKLIAYFSLFWVITGISWFFTRLVCRYALKKKILDVPNPRSSHTVPIPRGGGLAIVITSLAGLSVLLAAEMLTPSVFYAFLCAGGLVALIGFIDDHHHIAARWRLLVHFAAAALVLVWLGGVPPVSAFGVTVHPGWLGNTVAVICLVWLLNLYNFMDGIDGIAASEAVFVAGTGLLFASLASHTQLQWIAILVIASTLGFLFWNWPPARIFMGDVGSGFLGIVLGIYAWWSVSEDVTSIWVWLIVFGVFLVDATITLVRRFLRGLTWYEAHRSHAYQHAARRWGHLRVTAGVFLINIFWLLPIACLTHIFPFWGPALMFMALAPLVVLVLWLGAGLEESGLPVNAGH